MRTLFLTLITCLFALPAYAKYSGGTGDPNDPYQITTAADLIALGETPEDYGKHFILTADIDLDPNLPGRKVFDRAVIAPGIDQHWMFHGTPFTGCFDGAHHTISRLTIVGEGHLGLFGQLGRFGTDICEVKNLGLADVNITNITGSGVRSVGGLVGANVGAVTQCYSTGVVTGTSSVGGLVGVNIGTVTQCWTRSEVSGDEYWVGGLVGENGGVVTDCYSASAVRGNMAVGGLVGQNDFTDVSDVYDGTVANCYNIGAVHGKDRVGGLVGSKAKYDYVMHSYSAGTVYGESQVGGLVGGNQSTDTDPTVTHCFWDIQTSGQATSAGGTGKTTAEMRNILTYQGAGWDFLGPGDGPDDIWAQPEGGGYPVLWWQVSSFPESPRFSGGTGEPNDPFRVSTAEELNSIGQNGRLMQCHFKVTHNLDLSGIQFYQIGSAQNGYSGVFDGNGFTISNLAITGVSNLGLFARLASGAEVKDLGVVDVNISGSGQYIGGVAGYSLGSVIRCYSTGMISGRENVGGIAGYSNAYVRQCYSTSTVVGNGWIGGLVGENKGMVSECHTSGAIGTSSSSGVGGLVGVNYADVTRCYSTGVVTGRASIGGLVGQNLAGTVTLCYSSGPVTGSDQYAGGLVGDNAGAVTHSYSTASVRGNKAVGGLVGINRADVTQCYSAGTVSGNTYVGGLVGKNLPGYGNVSACFWDTQTSGQTTSAGGTGKTTASMKTAKTFLDAGWDFVGETANGTEDIWWILEGKDYPRLWWENVPQ